jgi:hypothetical protein
MQYRCSNRKTKILLGKLSNSGLAVRRYSEGGATGPAENELRRQHMPLYLVAIHHPDNYDPSVEGEAMVQDISALNKEMIAAGVRNFAGGLAPARDATSLRAQPNGEVLMTDGPYLESKEHIGGFWILETADREEALAWARKAAKACRAPVEVRAIFQKPTAAKN